MIRETRDPAVLNYFSALSDVAPHVGGPLDFSGAIHEGTVYLVGEHGGFCFERQAPGVYEGHVMITEAGRGRWAIEAGRQAVAMMAERGADHIWCRIRPDARHIAVFVQWCGFSEAQSLTDWRIFSWRKQCPH